MGSGTDALGRRRELFVRVGSAGTERRFPRVPRRRARRRRARRFSAGRVRGRDERDRGRGGKPTSFSLASGASALPEVNRGCRRLLCDEDATAAFPRFSDIDGPGGFGAE